MTIQILQAETHIQRQENPVLFDFQHSLLPAQKLSCQSSSIGDNRAICTMRRTRPPPKCTRSRTSTPSKCTKSRTSSPQIDTTRRTSCNRAAKRPSQPSRKGHQKKQATGKPDGLQEISGAPDTIRTYDTRFRRAVLYPLSYGGASRHFSTFRPMRHYFFAFPRPPCIPDDHRTACRSVAPMHENRAQTHPERASASCGLSPATCAA